MHLIGILTAVSTILALTVAKPTAHPDDLPAEQASKRATKPIIKKAVFAHYMVGNVNYNHAIKDINDASGMGLDGFALNVGDPTQPYVINLFNSIFDYTRDNHPNFKLFISMDLWALGNAFGKVELSKYDNLLAGFKGHGAWYTGPNGASFISTFSSGGLHDVDWAAFRTRWGNDLYLVPDFDDTRGYNTSDPGWWAYWGDLVDGTFFWESAWPKPGANDDGSVALDNVVSAGHAQHGKSFMAPLSALQYKNSYNTNYYRHGELNLVKRMENILSMPTKPDYVQVLTWNDGPESHYIGNLWLEQNNDTDPTRYANQQQWKHDGWRPLISSFITAFKDGVPASGMTPPPGVPAVGSLWYKTMLKSSVCPSKASNPRTLKPEGWEQGQDNLNWAVVIPGGQSYSVRLISNGRVLNTIPVSAGLHYGAQSGVIPGPQRMELIDGSGRVVLAASGGRCVSGGCPDCIYNMNYQVAELTTDTGGQGICPSRVCEKSVFAHYMVGTVYTDHAQKDIADAATMGFDGFALNIGDPRQSFVRDTFNSMFDYTRDNYPNFKLFFSLDLWAEGNAIGGKPDLGYYHDLLRDFKGHGAYLKGPDGKSFVSSYSSGGLNNKVWSDWREQWGQDVYFVPDFDDTAGFNTSDPGWWEHWGDVIDGSMSWETTWPDPGATATGTVAVDKIVAAGNDAHLKSYMIPLSPLQYKNAYDTNYYRQGELNLIYRIQNILNMPLLPDFVEFLTWNDGPESHYIGNLWFEQNNDTQPYKYANPKFDHTGWQPILTSFITAFKNRSPPSGMRPPAGKDAVGAMWYKTVLQSTVCPFPNADKYSAKPRGFKAPDQVVWAVILSSDLAGYSIRALLDGVEVGRKAAVAGLNYGTAPVGKGFPRLELVNGAGNVVLAAAGGRCISDNCPDCIFNMNPQVVALGPDTHGNGECPSKCSQGVTTDGTCGPTKSCDGWAGGSCCGPQGKCGSGLYFCGVGCQNGPCVAGGGVALPVQKGRDITEEMGPGQYLGTVNIVNGSPHNILLTSDHEYQMDNWKWESIPAGKAVQIFVKFSTTKGTDFNDGAGEAFYKVDGQSETFAVLCRVNKGQPYIDTQFDEGLLVHSSIQGNIMKRDFQGDGRAQALVIAGDREIGYWTNADPPVDWMQQLLPTIGNWKIGHVCMPGSHDAGMSKVTDATSPVMGMDNTGTQVLDIGGQLMRGSRYFDVRPAIKNGKFVTVHGESPFIGYGQDIDSIVQQVNEFTAKYKELIIIYLSHTQNSDKGTKGLTNDEWALLHTKLKGINDRYTGSSDANINLVNLPLNEFISKTQARVLIIGDNNNPQISEGLFTRNNFPFYDNYSDKNVQPEMATDQLTRLNTERNLVADEGSRKDSGFHILSWTLTLQTIDFIAPTTIAGYAVGKALDPLFWKAYNAFTPQSYPTVLFVDYVGEYKVSQLAQDTVTGQFTPPHVPEPPEGISPDLLALAMAVNLGIAAQNAYVVGGGV